MPPERQESRLREQARGVGFVVLLGALVCLVGVTVISLFVWAMT
jgi:hypothetical protein